MAAEHESQLPEPETVEIARHSAIELSKLLAERPAADRARIQLDGRDLLLPRQAVVLLRDLLAEMARGNAVALVPRHAQLTTQEAANILNVSRPHLVKLLEENEIPYSKVGTHRRVLYQDLMAYKQMLQAQSESALDELARLAQEHELGY